jgi:hypothetical protein
MMVRTHGRKDFSSAILNHHLKNAAKSASDKREIAEGFWPGTPQPKTLSGRPPCMFASPD